MINVLLEAGANLDARDDNLRTPLHEALQYPAAIQMLSWLRVPTWRLETAEARHRSMLQRLLSNDESVLRPRSWLQVRT